MDLNIAQLRALFEPFDLPHLFRLWIVLTFCVFLWGGLIATCGGYTTPRQFWKIHLIIIGSVLLLSGVAFLCFAIDPLFLLISLSALAFVAQGDLAANLRKDASTHWRSFPSKRQQDTESKVVFDVFKRLEPKLRKRRFL